MAGGTSYSRATTTGGIDQGGRTRRERRRGGARWLSVRRQAFERDRACGAGCWICAAEGRDPTIDYSLGYSTGPKAYEADHFIPVCDHPELEYDLANLRASHQACNRKRKTKAGLSLLGNPSRDWRKSLKG